MREEKNKQINRNSRLRQLITRSLILGGLFCVSLTGCVQKSDTGGNLFEGQFAPLLDGMGDHHFENSTDDTLVQRYFNQGMILTYGFNHAEIVFREDLEEFPKNGWSLFGLWQSLEAQGKSEEAEEVKPLFEEAWVHADFELTE